jgi:hypothetical protein
MREEILKRFFVGEVGTDVLAADLDGSMVEGRDTTRHYIEDFEASEEDFEVQPKHLVSICDAVLNGGIEAQHLRIIGFCIVGSDTFKYDTDVPEGDLVGETVLDWSAPEANYPLTIENVRKFRERLITGRNPFAADGAGQRSTL